MSTASPLCRCICARFTTHLARSGNGGDRRYNENPNSKPSPGTPAAIAPHGSPATAAPINASPDFWRAYRKLPKNVQATADKNLALFKDNPRHPSLQYRPVSSDPNYYTVRIGMTYRAVAVKTENGPQWVWIGSHEAYNNLRQFRH
jgi:hypothetical protein